MINFLKFYILSSCLYWNILNFQKLYGNLLISGIFLKMLAHHVARDCILRKNADIIFSQTFFKKYSLSIKFEGSNLIIVESF